MRHHARVKQLERNVRQLSTTLQKLRKELAPATHHHQKYHVCDHAERVAGFLALGHPKHEDVVLEHLLMCSMDVLRAQRAVLTLLNPSTDRLVVRAAIGDGTAKLIGREVPRRGSPHGLVFATGETHSTTPLHKSGKNKGEPMAGSSLIAPLAVGGDLIGTVGVMGKLDAGHFGSREMEQLKRFADVAALVIHRGAREQILRQGLATGNARSFGSQISFGPNDLELLELFEDVTSVKRSKPELLSAVRRFVRSLTVDE